MVTRLDEIKEAAQDWVKEPSYTPFGDYVGYADVQFLLDKIEIAEKSLLYIEGFHIRGIEDKHLEAIRLKATEFLKDIRE